MRLRNNANALPELKKTKYLLQKFPYKLNEKTIVEIGMGKGEMITQLAKNNPSNFYIGIEKYATVAYKAMKRAEELELNNFLIICEDVVNLPTLLTGKIKTIWLTFSDPWPKSRHQKRRLTHISFLNLYKKILTDDGVIKFKTDNDKLFEWTVEHMVENNIKLINTTRDFHSHELSKNNIMTEYEKKWSSQGKNINYLEAIF